MARDKVRYTGYVKGIGIFWFRLFGYGVMVKDITKRHLLFSERMGYVKTLKIGKWSIKLLKP